MAKHKLNQSRPTTFPIKLRKRFWRIGKESDLRKSVENRPSLTLTVSTTARPSSPAYPIMATLGSIVKDVIPRYQTMKGQARPPRWGWDCHGLPAENKVEKQLGINSKKEIETLGIDKFIAACKDYVGNVSAEWEWYVDHIGRWVDFKNAYKTMDTDYMESVIWVFHKLYDKKLIYKGKRVSLFCPRCSTPISNFEVAMDNSYKDVTDPSVFAKFKVKGEDKYLLAWTTTPWTCRPTSPLVSPPTRIMSKSSRPGSATFWPSPA